MKFLTTTVATLALVGSASAFTTLTTPRSVASAPLKATLERVTIKEPVPAIAAPQAEPVQASPSVKATEAVPAWKKDVNKRVQTYVSTNTRYAWALMICILVP